MTDPGDAVHALRDRGVDQPEALLAYETPERIIAACRRWDTRRGVRAGLLVRWIRNHEIADQPPIEERGAQLAARFAEYAAEHPIGTIVARHDDLQARRWPDEEPCPGALRVTELGYPVLELRCQTCGFIAALTPRSLHVLDQIGAF